MNDQQTFGGPAAINIPNTQKPAYNPLQVSPELSGFNDYLTRGYSTLHNLAANVVLKIEMDDPNAQITMLNAPMPATFTSTDDFSTIISGVLPLLLLLIFIPPVYNTIYLIVREKESRIKESMRMMGMRDTAYWLSWYAYYSILSTVMVFMSWLVCFAGVFSNSNMFLILIFYICYAQAVFA